MKKQRTVQQYVLKRKVKSAVKSKLDKAKVKVKQKQSLLKMPQTAPAATPESTEEKLPPGFKAKTRYENGGVKVTADIRYETEKTEPLVKVKHIGPNNEIVHREFVGPAKVGKWFDDNGNEIAKAAPSPFSNLLLQGRLIRA